MAISSTNQELPFILKGRFFKVSMFEPDTGKVSAHCQVCDERGTVKVIHGNIRPTSNFTTHLKTCHNEIHSEYKSLMEDHTNKLKNTKQSTLPFERILVPAKSSRVENFVVDYIIDALVPLSTVDNKAFRSLIAGISDGSKCPDRKKLGLLIKDRFKLKVASLKGKCAAASHYCLTADVWSSRRRSFMDVTIHWLNKSLDRESAVLTVQRFKGSHDFEKLTDMLLQIFDRYGIVKEKITSVVTDNGSNFVKAFKEYGVKLTTEDEEEEESEEITAESADTLIPASLLPAHQRCASHTLSLVATNDLNKANIITARGPENFKNVFRSAMTKCDGLWNVSSRSNKIAEELFTICGKSIVRPNATRWNSTFDAITKLLQLKAHLDEIFNAAGIEVLSLREKEFLEEYVTAMTPVAYALDKLQGEKSFYFGYLAPVILRTLKKLDEIKSKKTRFASNIADVLSASIRQRFKSICNLSVVEAKPAILAAMSFPYFKLRWIPAERQEALKQLFIAEAKTTAKAERLDCTQPLNSGLTNEKDDNFFDFEDTGSSSSQTMENHVELECLNYFQDGSVDLKSLEGYSIVRQMFQKYNTSLASSAPVERAFSYWGLILSPKRSSLSDEMLDMLVVLKVTY